MDADAVEGGLLYVGHLDFDVAPSSCAAPRRPTGSRRSRQRRAPRRFAGVDYLIVTHAAFRDQADRIAGLKRSEGYRAAVVGRAGDLRPVHHGHHRGGGGRPVHLRRGSAARAEVRAARGRRQLRPHGTASRRVRQLRAVALRLGCGVRTHPFGSPVCGRERRPEPRRGHRAPAGADRRRRRTPLVAKIARQGARPTGKQVFAGRQRGSGRSCVREPWPSRPGRSRARPRSPGRGSPREPTRRARPSGRASARGSGHPLLRPRLVRRLGRRAPARDRADAAELAGSPETVVFAWACESHWFLWPFGPSLGEALLLQPEGGASASFGPTGITEAGVAGRAPGRGVPSLLQPGADPRRGGASRQGGGSGARTPDALGPVVHGWNLLGDPSLKLARAGSPRSRPAQSDLRYTGLFGSFFQETGCPSSSRPLPSRSSPRARAPS